jgi:hypothetical protein
LIAQWFFQQSWKVVNRREQVLAPRAGFEPATNRLTAGCSTTELPGNSAVLVCKSAAYNKAARALKAPKATDYFGPQLSAALFAFSSKKKGKYSSLRLRAKTAV